MSAREYFSEDLRKYEGAGEYRPARGGSFQGEQKNQRRSPVVRREEQIRHDLERNESPCVCTIG